MPNPRLTGSSLDRILHCPGSAVLPAGEATTSKAAQVGTSLHDELERRSDKLAEGLAAHGYSIEELWPASGLHEVQVWYDPLLRRGGYRVRGARPHRDYDGIVAPMVGTIDYLHPALGMVDDLKTGYPPAPTSLQLGLAAVALADQAGPFDQVTCSITAIKVNKYGLGRPARKEHVYTPKGLRELKDVLDAIYARHGLEGQRLELGAEYVTRSPSSWACRYCPARQNCDRRWTAPDGTEP